MDRVEFFYSFKGMWWIFSNFIVPTPPLPVLNGCSFRIWVSVFNEVTNSTYYFLIANVSEHLAANDQYKVPCNIPFLFY